MATRYVWGKYARTRNFYYDLQGEYDSEGNSSCGLANYFINAFLPEEGYINYLDSNFNGTTGKIYYGSSISFTGNTDNVDGYMMYEVTINNYSILNPPLESGTSRYFTIPANVYYAAQPTCWVFEEDAINLFNYCNYAAQGDSGVSDDEFDSIMNSASRLLYEVINDESVFKHTLCKYSYSSIIDGWWSTSNGLFIDYDYRYYSDTFVGAKYVVSSSPSEYKSTNSTSSRPSSTTEYVYNLVYQDYPDPTSVIISPSTNLVYGDTVTIKVTTGTKQMTTGLKYEYEDALYSSSSYWYDLDTKSYSSSDSSLNLSYLLNDSGSNSIRVRAIDSYGYVGDWVYSDTIYYTVKKLYVAKSGTIYPTDLKVGVGGGVRTAKATVCKGGVIKTL